MSEIQTPKLKIGDPVQLISGSPTMTVSVLKTTQDFGTGKSVFFGVVRVTWFEGSKAQSMDINQDALKLVPKP